MADRILSKVVYTFRQLWAFRKTLIIILTPILLLPLPVLVPTRPSKCAYAVAIMAVYWVTEVIPMAVTAILPMVLMPALGVLGAKQLAVNYLKDTNMLFVGGLIVAVAVEKWNLHKRIALRVLMLVGSNPRWLMFGFMTTTAFLSMWISNTATTAMMVPIAQAVLQELKKTKYQSRENPEGAKLKGCNNPGMDTDDDEAATVRAVHTAVRKLRDHGGQTNPALQLEDGADRGEKAEMETIKISGSADNKEDVEEDGEEDDDDKDFSEMSKGVTLCIAYAANIGGTATLTGTGPNLVLSGQMDTLFGSDHDINFSSWFIYAFPNMVVTLIIAWLWLQLMFLGWRTLFGCCAKGGLKGSQQADDVIKAEYEKLGPISFAEVSVLIHFIVLALLWLTRDPEFISGWSVLFEDGYVTDAAVALMISVLLFMFPSRRPNFMCLRAKNDDSKPGPVPALLDWKSVHHGLPWSVVILLGGGFALADACKESGLSAWIGEQMIGMREYPIAAVVFILCILVATFTEFTSNVATATIFLPILASLAQTIDVNPLYLMIPVTVSTSFAFMLPVATPPNAIVFAYGHLRIIDMVKCGVVMNMVCVLMVTLTINTYGAAYFKLDTFPTWAALPADNINNSSIVSHNSSALPTILETTTWQYVHN